MEILTYKEIVQKDQLLPLLDHAFGWPFNPQRFEEFARLDPRLKEGAVGFAIVERDHVAGFVGVMDIPTRALDGSVKKVGGVYGVATMATNVRKHISTALMEHAHEYFRERGFCFSFLFTQRYLVSHCMYEKLGYSDLLERPSAHRALMLPERKTTGVSKGREKSKLNLEEILRIYNSYTKDKTGVVVRDRAHMTLIKKSNEFTARDCIIDGNSYVFFKKNPSAWVKGTWIMEFIASNKQDANRLLTRIEACGMDLVYDRAALDKRLREVYKARGYDVQSKSHGVMMVKRLTEEESFSRTYGDRFYIAPLDFF